MELYGIETFIWLKSIWLVTKLFNFITPGYWKQQGYTCLLQINVDHIRRQLD